MRLKSLIIRLYQSGRESASLVTVRSWPDENQHEVTLPHLHWGSEASREIVCQLSSEVATLAETQGLREPPNKTILCSGYCKGN